MILLTNTNNYKQGYTLIHLTMKHWWLNTENGELYPGRKEAKRKLGKCRFEKMAAKKKLLLIKQTCIWENEETDSNLSETAHR